MSATQTVPFDLDLFDLLLCPQAKAPLKWVNGTLISTDEGTRRRYRVEEGIPIMLVEESSEMDLAEWKRCMAAPGPVGGGAEAVRARRAAQSR